MGTALVEAGTDPTRVAPVTMEVIGVVTIRATPVAEATGAAVTQVGVTEVEAMAAVANNDL